MLRRIRNWEGGKVFRFYLCVDVDILTNNISVITPYEVGVEECLSRSSAMECTRYKFTYLLKQHR
jgi:hypothetical protein